MAYEGPQFRTLTTHYRTPSELHYAPEIACLSRLHGKIILASRGNRILALPSGQGSPEFSPAVRP